MTLILALSTLLAQVQEPPAPDGGAALQICLAAAADYSPVYPTQTIFPGREAAAVFRFRKGETHKKLSMVWSVVDAGKAFPPRMNLAQADLPLEGRTSGGLRLTELKDPLVPGQYRLDVSLDGRPWMHTTFAVAEPPKLPDIGKPEEFLAIAADRSWSYDIVTEAGEGMKLQLPTLTRGPDGKYRGAVGLKAAGADAQGLKIEYRQKDALVMEEWLRLDGQGLCSLRQKLGATVLELKPPLPLFPFPLKTAQNWTYQSADGAVRQNARMWGPLPVKGPRGEGLGFIVLIEQPGEFKTSIERHYLPGVGLVREVKITSANRSLVSRQELTLKGS